MGQRNKIYPDKIYYLTTTVVGWIDVFTRPVYRHIIVDSIKYCQKEKGLILHSWCLMSNHLHWIASAEQGKNLSDILRDFKKFTNKKIIEEIINNSQESRKKWLLSLFKNAGKNNQKIKNYKFWQDSNEAKELITNKFIAQKLNYIHKNPVIAEIVEKEEHYLYSSAKNYADEKGLIDVVLIV